VRLRAANALLAKRRPSRVTYRLRTRKRLKIISGIKNILLVLMSVKLLTANKQ
jgi:hypothetical protein